MSRLILIDNNSGYIFGDTADFAAGSAEWRDNNSGNASDQEGLALLAARLLDQSIGESGRGYKFLSNDPRDTRTGYRVYRSDVRGSDQVGNITDGQDQEMVDAVERDCDFIGFVEIVAAAE
jgi:hypothetical protein